MLFREARQEKINEFDITTTSNIQARKAQLVAYWLGTREVPGSNPGKGQNFSVKISK